MSREDRAMHIRLSQEQTRRLLEWAGKRTSAEAEESIQPSGYRLEIEIDGFPPFSIQAKGSGSAIDLGDVDVALVNCGVGTI